MMDSQATIMQSPRVSNSHLVPPSHVHLQPPPTTTPMDFLSPGGSIANSSDLKSLGSADESRPLMLLSLPLDVLKDIVKEVTHTNDLTSLALCHSALHRLAIPHIYSRFDIVWPDASTHLEPRSGVDALTYGLATLVMNEDVFDEAPSQQLPTPQPTTCTHCGQTNLPLPLPQSHTSQLHPRARKRRRGNHYARFTRKFSLGNGPPDWVQEYMITKEGGKMLGTLVALAVARMRNLETFVWDMPTGVLRDVWMALSSLGERSDGEDCRLERLWIRWHDNSQMQGPSTVPAVPAPTPANPLVPLGNNNAHQAMNVRALQNAASTVQVDRVESPTFSILPPLKSLSVLDVDELAYLDEMSILISRSCHRLQELRVGIARHARNRDWVASWEGAGLQQVGGAGAMAQTPIGEKRLGGVLGVLMGNIYNIREQEMIECGNHVTDIRRGDPLATTKSVDEPSLCKELKPNEWEINDIVSELNEAVGSSMPTITKSSAPQASKYTGPHFIEDLPASGDTAMEENFFKFRIGGENISPKRRVRRQGHVKDSHMAECKSERLGLKILELERVPLSVKVLGGALDWSMLADLTLLDCPNHEQLWKVLRRKYTPGPRTAYTTAYSVSCSSSLPKASGVTRPSPYEYFLNLRKIHTNAVSTPLISFLKETLAPNTLEVLFLQESRAYVSNVSINAIFRGPLRRHRASLKKMSIDSSDKAADGHTTTSSSWRKWKLTREILGFITSGRMHNLKELGMAIDYHDWHYFLQRLPTIPQIRCLYIPFVADHAHGNNIDARELAMQIVDIVTLRPDVELAYLGIATKCFEILEARSSHDSHESQRFGEADDGGTGATVGVDGHAGVVGSDDEEEDGDDGEGDDEGDGDGAGDDDDGNGVPVGEDDDDTEMEEEERGRGDEEDEGESEFDGEDGKVHLRLRLREILFYDDKVAVFKARHGRL